MIYRRFFKLWYYTVSHKQALLRSPSNDNMENIDLYFSDVSYIDIPTTFNNLEIVKPTFSDENYIFSKIGMTKQIITVLKCGERRYYIVSSIVKEMHNNLSMFELPFDIP